MGIRSFLQGHPGDQQDRYKMLMASELTHGNSGFWILNPVQATEQPPATLVVSGLGRSGTSMLAEVLHTAGLHMGNQLGIATFEDQELASLLSKNNNAQLKNWIQGKNRLHAQWGFKLPTHRVLQRRFLSQLRRPAVVIVFRDILSVAGRRHISRHEDLIEQLSQATNEYRRMLKQIHGLPYPCLLVSYEKALQNPEQLVAHLQDLMGLELDPGTKEACINCIQTSPGLYRKEVHQPRGWLGRLEKASQTELAGWIFSEDGRSSSVDVWVNGHKIGSIKANQARPDVQRDHKLKTDRCGFSVDPRALGQHISVGDQITATFAGTDEHLLNSPTEIS